MEKEYVYLEFIYKDGHKEYSGHDIYWTDKEPSHHSIMSDVRSAKSKRSRFMNENKTGWWDKDLVDIKIKKVIVKFTDIEEK